MMPLRQAIREYLALRRSLGYRLREAAGDLAHFITFLEQKGAEVITVALALEWALPGAAVPLPTATRRLTAVRGFARHWQASDPRTEVPPVGLLPVRGRRARPHLYTAAELQRLLAAPQALPPLRGATYGCLIGLLAVTGLRPGEALALTPGDVDLHAGILTIRQGKFGKSHLVPVHPSTLRALRTYARRRVAWLAGRLAPTFFVSDRGGRRDYALLLVPLQTGLRLSELTGLRRPDLTLGPGAHVRRQGKGRVAPPKIGPLPPVLALPSLVRLGHFESGASPYGCTRRAGARPGSPGWSPADSAPQ